MQKVTVIRQLVDDGHFNEYHKKLIRGYPMKSSFKILIVISMIVVLISYCSEDKNPLPSVSHPEEWNTAQSADFHGKKVLAAGYETCKSCHGADFKGGKSGASCYGSNCHSTFPHQAEWNYIDNANSHGAYVKANSGAIENCKKCHGSDLSGGTSKVSCYGCHPGGSLP